MLGHVARRALIVLPSLLSADTRATLERVLPVAGPSTIVLGLDLQGGAHLLLEVDSAPSVTRTQVDNLRDDARRSACARTTSSLTGGIGRAEPRRAVPGSRCGGSRQDRAGKLRNQSQSLGIDADRRRTGLHASAPRTKTASSRSVLTDAGNQRQQGSAGPWISRSKCCAAVSTPRAPSEPTIQREGADRILVEVPGLQDTQRLKDLLGTTAKLEFRSGRRPGRQSGGYRATCPIYKNSRTRHRCRSRRSVMVQGEDLTDAQPGFDSADQRARGQLPLQSSAVDSSSAR